MHEHIYIHAYIHTYIQVRDKERNTLVHAAARGGLPALAMDLVDMLGADAIDLQNAQGESALDVASGLSGVGMALMRRVPAEVLRTMDRTRVPWLHEKLRTLVVPLLLAVGLLGSIANLLQSMVMLVAVGATMLRVAKVGSGGTNL